jgi:hypothetical protein
MKPSTRYNNVVSHRQSKDKVHNSQEKRNMRGTVRIYRALDIPANTVKRAMAALSAHNPAMVLAGEQIARLTPAKVDRWGVAVR